MIDQHNERVWMVFDDGQHRKRGPYVWEGKRRNVPRLREYYGASGFKLVAILRVKRESVNNG